MTDTNQASEDGLRELAERYAKDFGIRYDKIRINQKGSITYRQSGDNSGGWQESGSSLNLPMWVITRHYQLVRTEKLQARIHELQGIISWNVDAKTNLKVVSTITAMERVAELKQELEKL